MIMKLSLKRVLGIGIEMLLPLNDHRYVKAQVGFRGSFLSLPARMRPRLDDLEGSIPKIAFGDGEYEGRRRAEQGRLVVDGVMVKSSDNPCTVQFVGKVMH
jgi:hypothetical protein